MSLCVPETWRTTSTLQWFGSCTAQSSDPALFGASGCIRTSSASRINPQTPACRTAKDGA
eukprot:6911726-Pyramimonas_sp.AAC.1